MAEAVPEPTGSVRTRDGTRLSYIQAGPADGASLLLVHGWRQSAAQWYKQINHFAARGLRVTAYDHRGHGASDHPPAAGGTYTVRQLAADLADLLAALDLRGVVAVGHSMGCSVLWALWEEAEEGDDAAAAATARDRIRGAVFVDQSPHMRVEPGWTAAQAREVGATFTPAQLDALPGVFEDMAPGLARSMYSGAVSDNEFAWATAQADARCPVDVAVALLQDHVAQDWRASLAKIHVPSLVISGELSILPVECGRYNHEHIPGSRFLSFSAEERGSHFLFFENPEKFNQVLEGFISEDL